VEGVGKVVKEVLGAERKSSFSSAFFLTAFVGVRFLFEEVGVARCAIRRCFVGVWIEISAATGSCDVLAVVEVEGAGDGNL